MKSRPSCLFTLNSSLKINPQLPIPNYQEIWLENSNILSKNTVTRHASTAPTSSACRLSAATKH